MTDQPTFTNGARVRHKSPGPRTCDRVGTVVKTCRSGIVIVLWDGGRACLRHKPETLAMVERLEAGEGKA